MHISFAVFADAANLSQEGKLNVMGIFDALTVGGLPVIHPRTHFVLRLKGNSADAGEHTLTFRWTNPNGEELWQSSGNLQLAPAPKDSLAFEADLPVIAVLDLPLDVVGYYAMHVELDHEMVIKVPLLVQGPIAPLPTLGMMS